ncbi:ATP-binding protein [Niallia oryzisoli]|uniref:HAMP domain-containing sensor histidine kinase n=1 Tax=Niallia oryzisoli TaxID=1737571 RepID=UPI0037367657
MRSLPIRLRLTLWNCLLFGIIIAVVITVIYYTHKQDSYNNVDLMLSNISSHVDEEITRQLNEGIPLEKVTVSADSLSVNEIAVMVKNNNGEMIKTNSHPFFKGHQLIKNNKLLEGPMYQTITDENGVRIRVNIKPIFQDKVQVGLIETLYSLFTLDRSVQKFKWIVISLTVLGIALASVAAWFLAKKTLWRVDLIGKTAKAITASQDFNQRVLYTGPPDELGQLSETFNQMLDSLEKAYKNQRRFLSDASHELRAPLTTIRGNLDILYKMKNIPESEKEEILGDIRNEAIRMSKLVSDLLSLARADAGQIYQKKVINLSMIATEVMGEIDLWEKEVSVNANIIDHLNIWGDRDLIKQVLIILIDNAINYTPSNGEIFLTITKEKRQAVIRIQDSGIGIQPDELPFIFDRFYRTEAARRKSPDGTGLGLSIAKWIVDEHEGNIELKSKPGEGTAITTYIPLVVH